jgi:Fe-S-cluster containining protein
MTPESSGSRQMATTEIAIEARDWKLKARVTVPLGPTRISDLLPLARALSDGIVSESCKAVAASGEKISCKKGCGACCNNLVAISEVEARRIRDVIENLAEPRRAEIRARFADARQRLERAGLLEKLQQADRWSDDDYTTLVGTYFQQGIPCPFLEDGCCSIYDERPITCREYLVTSPPEHCAKLGSADVRRVRLPLTVFNAVARWQAPPAEHFLERCVPLILAPEWAETHRDEPPAQPGPDLLRELINHLTHSAPKDSPDAGTM